MARKIIVLVSFISLCFLMTSCYNSPLPQKLTRNNLVPPYLVMITSESTKFWHQCGGIQVNSNTVITVAHCLPKDVINKRILTQYNQTLWFSEYTKLESLDLAIIKTSVPLYTEEYPTFGSPKPGLVDTYGLCAQQFYFNSRPAAFINNMEFLPSFHEALQRTRNKENQIPLMDEFYSVYDTYSLQNSICLGDSGGIVLQDGKVVGMIEDIFPLLWLRKSQYVAALDGDTIYTILSETGNLAEVNK